MKSAESWLFLKVREFNPSENQKSIPRVYISVPKRLVRKAVLRNRIRRVLREAVRKDSFFLPKKIYFLKLLSVPKSVSLEIAKKALVSLHG